MRNTKRILMAAVAAVGLGFAGEASAQYQVGSDGRALDASNQIGSGGYNQSVGRRTSVSPDDIVYGNVTAGRQFRGRINTFDAREFRGSTVGRFTDNFVAGSAGAPLAGQPRVDLTRPQTFYGQGRGVQPPANSTPIGFTGAFVQTPTDLRIDRQISATSIGAINYARPGTTVLPGGMVGSTEHRSVLTGSPLFGVREMQLGDPYLTPGQQGQAALGTSESAQLQRMRQELQNLQVAPVAPDGQPAQPGQPGTPSLNDAVGRPAEAPDNTPLGQKEQLRPSALGGDLATGASRANRLLLPSAAQQSTQYAEMQRRLERFERMHQGQSESDLAAQRFREQQRLAAQLEGQPRGEPRPGQPGQAVQPAPRQPVTPAPAPAPAPRQGTVAPPAAPQTPPAREVVIPENLPKPGEPPVQVKSLAEGIQAEGLRNLMQQAEESLKRGRYRDALVAYEQAQEVAPNNPLIQLGKVNALIGSTSFARAYPELRNAFAQDPALLLAQYDLKTMFGQENLERIVKDLKFVAGVEKTSPEAMFLLAYVAYNTGNESLAGEYLAEANKRAGGRDPVVQLLQKYWTLPQAPSTQPAELNK